MLGQPINNWPTFAGNVVFELWELPASKHNSGSSSSSGRGSDTENATGAGGDPRPGDSRFVVQMYYNHVPLLLPAQLRSEQPGAPHGGATSAAASGDRSSSAPMMRHDSDSEPWHLMHESVRAPSILLQSADGDAAADAPAARRTVASASLEEDIFAPLASIQQRSRHGVAGSAGGAPADGSFYADQSTYRLAAATYESLENAATVHQLQEQLKPFALSDSAHQQTCFPETG